MPTKPPPDAWVDDQGKIITVADVIDALTTAGGLIALQIEDNRAIKENPVQKREYSRKLFIVNRVKRAYEMSVLLSKQPTREIPKKKKKKGPTTH